MNRKSRLRRTFAVHTMRGFTLIELMITVAIVAILAAIAIPSYQDSIWKGKRGEAKAAILKTLQAEERYYSQSNTYVAYSGTSPSGAFPVYSADNANNSRYTIAATAASVTANGTTLCLAGNISQCVVVTATVIGTADPKCGSTLQMDSVGNKLPVQSGSTATCWK